MEKLFFWHLTFSRVSIIIILIIFLCRIVNFEVLRRMRRFLKNNLIVWTFVVCCVLIEYLSVCFTAGFPFLMKPYYFLLIVIIFASILILVKNKIAQTVLGGLVLIGQSVLEVGMVFLYDSNGTFFEWSMMSQRNDAAGALQKIDLNVWLVLICVALVALFIALSVVFIVKSPLYKAMKEFSKVERKEFKRILKNREKIKWQKRRKIITNSVTSGVLSLSILVAFFVPFLSGVEQSHASYVEKLYGSTYNTYQQYGITGNAVYQAISGIYSNKVDTSNMEKVTSAIYGDGSDEEKLEISEYFGVSEGNNLVYILVESFEWYAWLNEWYDAETLQTLYPNLYKFMGESVVLDNFYAREKTDTSEILSLLGSNPTGEYVNYGFPENEYPWSLPNMFRSAVENSENTLYGVNSFHHNYGSFYNRKTLHNSLGFDYFYSIEDMEEHGVVGTVDKGEWCKDEWTLDSLAWDKMRDFMFPSVKENEQFMTFAITFVMHGLYVERENLKNGYNGENYYASLDSYGLYPAGNGEKSDYLRNYAAAVMDFDRAIGIMMNTLEEKDLLDRTTIVMFADHNTYYNNLAYYAKGIDETYNSELYRIPCMIYDQKLTAKMEENGDSTTISKFTTTADLIPTILDLFGIHGWKNLYFGTSVFVPEVESIIYSRAYGIFVTDKLICYSANKLLYTCEGFAQEDKEDFIERATIHLNKLEILDKIFYGNYFKTHEYISA